MRLSQKNVAELQHSESDRQAPESGMHDAAAGAHTFALAVPGDAGAPASWHLPLQQSLFEPHVLFCGRHEMHLEYVALVGSESHMPVPAAVSQHWELEVQFVVLPAGMQLWHAAVPPPEGVVQ